MYRKSSRGNPYHDARGRFTTSGGADLSKNEAAKQGLVKLNKKGEIIDDKRPVMWSSFEDQQDIKGMSNKKLKKFDYEKNNEHLKDGKRFYHNRSIQREKNAIAVSSYTIPKGLSQEKRQKELDKAWNRFAKENAVALKNAKKTGAKIIQYRQGNSNTVAFQIVESKRITYDDTLGFGVNKTVTRNTSSSMELFHGYTVDFNDDPTIRASKIGASPEEIVKALDNFCKKQGKTMSKGQVHLHVTRDYKNRVQFTPSYYFETEAEAKAFAKKRGGTYSIVGHDDGSQA